MFEKIQHIGYYTADLAAAIDWYNKGFGALSAGGGDVAASVQVPGGGINAFLRFGQVEVELIQPGGYVGSAPGRAGDAPCGLRGAGHPPGHCGV